MKYDNRISAADRNVNELFLIAKGEVPDNLDEVKTTGLCRGFLELCRSSGLRQAQTYEKGSFPQITKMDHWFVASTLCIYQTKPCADLMGERFIGFH
jgi:hypothetical protein